MKKRIAVGTVSKQKIGYLEEVLGELGVEAEVFPLAAKSGVSEQPITDAETLEGATNRARTALAASPSADYGIGIEVGYDTDASGRYEIFCWSVIVDREGGEAKARSHSFLLPGFHQGVMRKGDYLGDYVNEYFAKVSDPVGRFAAEAIRGRKLFITESLRYALIYALHRECYEQ